LNGRKGTGWRENVGRKKKKKTLTTPEVKSSLRGGKGK